MLMMYVPFYIWLCYWVFKCISAVWSILKSYVFPMFGFYLDLKSYGEWAIVTGATDGIGKCYAFELAKRKMNIILISRSKQKLDAVGKEIEIKHGVKTKCIVFDFSIGDNYKVLEDELCGMDVGVLVNNVGTTGDSNLFDCIAMNEHLKVLHTNIFGELHLSHLLTKRMVQKGRGIIIHVSSSFGFMPLGLISLYAPSKAFINAFVTNLQKESNACKNVHHQLVTPFFVYTNMTNAWVKKGFFIPDAETYVSSAIKTVGIASHTYGCFSHEILGIVLRNVPTAIVNLSPFAKGFQKRCDYKRKMLMEPKEK